MKLLMSNLLTCAVKSCKISPASYPLHFRDAVLERTDIKFDPTFIANMIPRIRWDAFAVNVDELSLGAMMPDRQAIEEVEDSGFGRSALHATKGQEADNKENQEEEEMEVDAEHPAKEKSKTMTESEKEEVLLRLHKLLLETGVVEGKLVCRNCGFEYPIKDGVGNFLLPPHLV